MKSFLAVLLIVFGTTSLVSSKAVDNIGKGDNPQVKIVADEAKGTYNLFYESQQEGKVTIRIYDDANILLHSEVSRNQKSFAKRFYFKELPAGTYVFVISGPDFDFKETVVYETPTVLELKAELVEVTPGQKYRLVVSGTEKQAVKVRIYDTEGWEIFADEVELDMDSGRVFDLTQAATDDVVFVVADRSRTVTKTVNIK